MAERWITLLTDFGVRDPFVGIMKGVMLRICGSARFVDLTHEIPPQDLPAGAFYLRGSWSFFPPGTVHLVVVDPGVGTARRILAADCGGQRFVAPDNGVLEGALRERVDVRWWDVRPRRWLLDCPPSQTFHGRDHFAPVAAFLASGGRPEDIAEPIADPRRLDWDPPRAEAQGDLRGRIMTVDHFGNLITDLPGAVLESGGAGFRLSVGRHAIQRFARTFGEVSPGEIFAYVGSFGTIEVGCNLGAAARILELGPGEPAVLSVCLDT